MRNTIKPNDTFSYWTVVDYDSGIKKYKCVCVCGNTSFVNSSTLKSGKSKSCGCKQKESVGVRIKDSGYQSLKNKIFSNYRNAATRRGYEFLLTSNEFDTLITSNCFYCNSSPSMVYKYGRGNNMACDYSEFKYNGVDRLDNSKGYVVDNCVSCCKICNNSKACLSIEEWKEWLIRISEHYL